MSQKILSMIKVFIALFIAAFVIFCATGDITALGPKLPLQSSDCECEQQPTSTSAIRAPLLTIGSVMILLIRVIPTPSHPSDRVVNDLVILASVAVGVVAGWHWLSAETYGNPGPYLNSLLGASAVMAVGLSAWPIIDTFKRRRQDPPESG